MITILFALWLAHSWYPSECCSDHDCHPFPCKQVKPIGGGAWRFTSFAGEDFDFPRYRIQRSPDHDCHVCIHNNTTPTCLFLGIEPSA